MRKIKVFISSVIKGYEDRKDAAEGAIMELNHDEGFNFEVIRIEPNKYPAKNKPPQKACLDGVKECDIYLGIYPKNNYGWKESPVGISPTHEEFRQAVKDNKCRLVFVENTKEIDPRQDEFLREVGGYVDGRFWNEFEFGNVDQLKHMLYRALLNLTKANFEDFLQNYLKSLLKRYERIVRPWEEDVGSLSVSEVVQLELREEEQKEEKKSLTESDEIERHLEKLSKNLMFSDAIKEYRRLLIMGDPGAGKSTSLQWVAYSYARQILNSSQKELPVPIYLELKWYKNSLLELIATCFGENGVVCDEETINDWIKKEKFLFLLDCFDEVNDPSKCLRDIKQLMSFSRGNQFVVASRKIEALKDFQNLKFTKAEVKQLSDSQIELFIEKYLGKEKESRLLKELNNHDLLNEARNPLILWLMILEFQGEASQISINKGRLFKNVIEHHFLKEWDKKVIPGELDILKFTDLKVKALSKLAFSMIGKEDSVKIEEDKAKEIIDAFLKEGRTSYKELRDEILRQLFVSHILIKVGSQISFWHKSFRDYFAALELIEIFSRDPEEFVKRYATEKWEESILFSVGIMKDPSDFVNRLIQPFWRYFLKSRPKVSFRLLLAAKCIGASNRVDIETQQKVIEQLTTIIYMYSAKGKLRELRLLFFPILFDVDKAIQALGKTRSEKGIKFLGQYLENHNYEVSLSQDAVKAIMNMPSVLVEKIQDLLLFAALWHKDGVVRLDAKEILRENLTQETASRLIEIILNKNEKKEIRERAIYVMTGYLGEDFKYPDKSIDSLIQIALKEEDDDLRTSAAGSLGAGHHKDEDEENKIVNLLIHALHADPDANIRANAAYALVYHFSNKVPKAFIQALEDKDGKVLRRAAHSLAYITPNTSEEENEASQKLLRLFNNEDNGVRINALWTYKFIRKAPTDEEITKLINLLEDGNISIRYEAAEALGRLKARAALGALIQMVFDEKYADPWASAIGAILQIEPSFSEVVKENGWEDAYIDMLSDENIEERRFAAKVLRRIGTEKALPALKEMDEDYEKKRGMSGELFYAIRDIEERIRP